MAVSSKLLIFEGLQGEGSYLLLEGETASSGNTECGSLKRFGLKADFSLLQKLLAHVPIIPMYKATAVARTAALIRVRRGVHSPKAT